MLEFIDMAIRQTKLKLPCTTCIRRATKTCVRRDTKTAKGTKTPNPINGNGIADRAGVGNYLEVPLNNGRNATALAGCCKSGLSCAAIKLLLICEISGINHMLGCSGRYSFREFALFIRLVKKVYSLRMKVARTETRLS